MPRAAERPGRGRRASSLDRRRLGGIEATYVYLARLNPAAARRVAEALFSAGDSLAVFPNRGRIGLRPETRELLTVHPYVIVYRILDEEVQILRVWHGAQDRK